MNQPTTVALLRALEVVERAVNALPIEAFAEGTTELERLKRVLNNHYLDPSDIASVLAYRKGGQ